jgi:hypothetical protein
MQQSFNDPDLIAVIEEMAKRSMGLGSRYSQSWKFQMMSKWHIHEYDGLEHVAEDHRTWS